jgi:hypothetical protein
MILYPYLKPADIAKILGKNTATIRNIQGRPKFKIEYELRISLPTKILEESKKEAAIRLRQLLNAKSEQVQLKASALILTKELAEGSNQDDDTDIKFEGWDDNKS